MKKLFLYLVLAIALFITACGKDDFVNPEDTMFKKLARGNGVWDIAAVEVFTGNGTTEELDTTYNPDVQYVFHEASEIIGGTSITYNAVAITAPNQVGIRYALWGEQERIIFTDYALSVFDPQLTFTVTTNKRNSQVWETYQTQPNGINYTRTVYRLEYCGSCEPLMPPFQLGGI